MVDRQQRVFGNIRRLSSGRYQARYTGPDTVRHTAPTTFMAKMDAEAWLVNEERLISRDEWTPPAERQAQEEAERARKVLTFATFADRVISARAKRNTRPLRPSTVDNYNKLLRLALLPTFGPLPLERITPQLVAEWYALLPDTPTQNGNAYNLLHSIMSDAESQELIRRNPCRLKHAGKPAPKRVSGALTMAELAAYLEAAPERYRMLFLLAGWCGLRSGEVRALRHRDLDVKEGVVHVQQTVTRIYGDRNTREWVFGPPKTKAGIRTVAIPPHLLDAVRGWLATQKPRSKDSLLFPAVDGSSPINDSVLREAHKQAAKAIGRPTLTVHDLRRTAATMAAQAGSTTAELMRLLGHTTVNVAMLYQVPTAERDKERARRISEAARSQGL